MTDTAASVPATRAAPAIEPAADPRTPWLAPRVQTIAAGEAEQGTRSMTEVGFTTS